MTTERLDEIRMELARIQDELIALGDGDFEEQYRLKSLQDSLRDEAASLRYDVATLHAGRSTESLLQELEARRKQLASLEKQQINMMSQSLAGAQAAAFSASEWNIQHELKDALGIGEVQEHIRALRELLDERGVTYPDEQFS